jgi:hypothetical protein
MKTLIAACLLGTAMAVPRVRGRLAALLARLAGGTNVHVVPAPDRR